MTTTIEASCSCGGFKFNTVEPPIFQLTCHCQQCRDVSKAPFTNFAYFNVAAGHVAGNMNVREFVADSGSKTIRETCANCGELVTDRTGAPPKVVGIVAERIQPPYVFQPRCHVWLESRVVEPTIPAGVKAFPRGMQ